jgi:hypothetical protein
MNRNMSQVSLALIIDTTGSMGAETCSYRV